MLAAALPIKGRTSAGRRGQQWHARGTAGATLVDADFRGLIIAMIHKFEAIRKTSSQHDNIYVFIDEAHRSVAKDMGKYLMARIRRSSS